MPTTDELQQQINALTQRVDAITAPPTNYYTHRYSGEEIDNGVQGGLLLGIPSTKQQALRNIGGRPNRNLLGNAYFVGGGSQQGVGKFPINQRGQTSYTVGGSFTIDRWAIGSTQNSVSLTINEEYIQLAGDSAVLTQKLEAPKLLAGQTATLSCLARLSTNVSDANLYLYSYQSNSVVGASPIASDGQWHMVTLTVQVPNVEYTPGQLEFAFNISSGTLDIVAAKLELGSTQSLALEDDSGNWHVLEIPKFGAELAECQRYLVVYTLDGQRFVGVGHLDVASGGQVLIYTPVQMRALPTITGNLSMFGGGDNIAAQVLDIQGFGPTGVRCTFTVTNGTNAPKPVLMYTSGILTLSAEL